MKVRLGFAVAAHLEPDILIVDEVLAVGDAEFQKKAIGKMQEVSHEGGRTVLFVSHNMGSISELCSKTIILKNGSVSFVGNTDKAIEDYLFSPIENNVIDTDDFLLQSCSLSDLNNFKKESFYRSEDIKVSVRYKIKQPINELRLNFSIINNNGLMLTNIIAHLENTKLLGCHETSFFIPKNILKEGYWLIKVNIDIPKHKIICSDKTLCQFDIIDRDNYELRYPNAHKGIIKIKTNVFTKVKGYSE